MLRIWGSWDNFNQGIPLHLTPENNGFITWIGLHSGLYHYYFEGARQESGRAFFFTFIDDTMPFTQIWNDQMKQFRDENFIRVETRDIILQPYQIIDVNIINNANVDQEYFQYEMSDLHHFKNINLKSGRNQRLEPDHQP